MIQLLTTTPLLTIVLVLLVFVPAIVNFISWCKKTWAKREEFKQQNIEKGKQMEREDETEELRFTAGETRIKTLEDNVGKLTEIAENQQKMIKRLTESDMLDIKSWIKDKHEKYMAQGWIDVHALDLLCSRHGIYKQEGGNSWADCLVEELKSLPHTPPVTRVAPRSICDNSHDND